MNETLLELSHKYSELIENKAVSMQTFKSICEDRDFAYQKLKTSDETIDTADIIAERTAFWAVPYGILCNHSIHDRVYLKFLNLIIANDPAHKIISNNDTLKILEIDKMVLLDIKSKLKIHPKLAGVKINDINRAIKAINKTQQEIEYIGCQKD